MLTNPSIFKLFETIQSRIIYFFFFFFGFCLAEFKTLKEYLVLFYAAS